MIFERQKGVVGISFNVVQRFGLDTFTLELGFKFETLASESKEFVFWIELVALCLHSADYLSYVICERVN